MSDDASSPVTTDVRGPVAPGPDALVDDAVALARRWLAASEGAGSARERRTAERLGALVADPAGLELAVRFVDDVARPQDVRVAARALGRLGELAGGAGAFLGPVDRTLLRAGAGVATVLPSVVVPAARVRLRQLVGHLVADAGSGLGAHLARTRAEGYALNVNLLGEAVLGEDEANARLGRTIALVERPDVDYVSVKVSSVASQLVTWDLEGSRDRVVERLVPLYRAARDHGTFLNLDMEEYRDLALTTAVFQAVLAREELRDLEAGIVLQAYLPDALGALDELTAFAAERVAAGGAPVKVRLVKGANLAMEAVEAELHGWAQAPYPTKRDVDANYVRLLDHALRAPRTDAVRIGVASHNLFHVALAVLLGRARGVSHAVDVEMLQGMAPGEARAVRDEVARDRDPGDPRTGRVVLYTPVVRDEDFDVAISYLVRRLEENAAEQNFLHAMFAGDGRTAMQRQEDAFRASVDLGVRYAATDVTPRRRARGPVPGSSEPAEPRVARQDPAAVTRNPGFGNAPDTDPAVAASRDWARRVTGPDSGDVPVRTPELASTAEVDDAVARAEHATAAWSRVAPAARAAALRAIAARLEEARTDLVAAMVHEPGKTVAEADPEVSEAVDFAAYYADRAAELDPASGAYPGATFTPDGVTLVTPPWNFPVAIPVGGVLAALAAGSAVLAKPAPPTPRCLEVAVDAVHAGLRDAVAADPAPFEAAGLGPDDVTGVVQYVRVPDDERGRHLVSHPGVARVVLTGSIETAELFARWRPDRPVLAETSGKNALVVTPSADLDLAVADLVRSAFGHAGQKCSAASLAILVGSAGDPRTETGRRVRRQLVDAVRSLAVGPATALSTTMGPLTEPASGKLLRALTTLEEGESWLVEPRCLDAGEDGTGRLWTPGLKEGVRPGSAFHLTEYFGPVLGLMTAATLDEAVELQNAVPFGLTGGIHSLDDDEVERWLDAVQVGNAYVNRHITGAIVQRQSFGGWKRSSVGPGAKAGGPNYVAQLGTWTDAVATDGAADLPPARESAPDAWLAWARADDARWWDREFSRAHDPSALRAESNVFRYRPVDLLTVRVGADASPVEVERVLHAARTAGVPVVVLPAPGAPAVGGAPGTEVSDADLAARVRDGRVRGRVRVVGSSPGLREAAAERVGDVTVLDQPVVASGRRELLTVLHEQAVSRTMHRYGHVRA
ncbi:bifunctional proline dehydrogenase/L-glutamate gamma-semialdehyde dehydrogenase [Cellulosimicrobium marinum]|uniref:bifunctional proline dehydrogenase/L-glutamate gamma-semialdehyde dehydrogenase n=1 Tax=Cellulosimicrobium marinum TaxID=1638992 RepID=UPI001E588248|nr:bifunctional proline dehydrogenase/L-glutamate gamma-semialdehyde dehydrogenase [Cellulosimicrobium marinum]MCB7137144.1 bifunctional proline dehydrogenase/L-glutamate gamma-semialdehyde dehydrogenase [Cellulosimicrobium marinum]